MTIYSYSRLKCFEQCPQKYKLQYIDRIQTEAGESIEMFLGKRVHEVLRRLYLDLHQQKENLMEDLMEYLYNRWNNMWNNSILISRNGYDREGYLQMAETCIRDYYNHYKPFDHGRTIAVEKRIVINLERSSNYKLCGYIDRVTKTDDGFYEIHDYKTSSHLASKKKIQHDWQLGLYAIMLKQRYPYIKNIRLIWYFLRFDKKIVITPTDEDLNRLRQNIIKLIDNIKNTQAYAAKSSKMCKWCTYKQICK